MRVYRESDGRIVIKLSEREEALLSEVVFNYREFLGRSSAWKDLRYFCTALNNQLELAKATDWRNQAKGGTHGKTKKSKQKTKSQR